MITFLKKLKMGLCLPLALWAILFAWTPLQARTPIDKVLVTINDEPIFQSDLDAFQKKMATKQAQEAMGVDGAALNDRRVLLELLLEEKIIEMQVKKLDLRATDQEVDAQIKSILRKNNITQKILEDRLAQLKTSFAEYRLGIQRQIERHNLIEREIKPGLDVSESQLRLFYKQTANKEETATQYKLAHILVTIKGDEKAALERAKKIAEEAKENPGKFTELANQYSDDKSTAASGGDLGFSSVEALANEFKPIVPSTPVGATTAPIKTAAGYHILKVVEAGSPGYAALSKEKKEALRNQLLSIELERKMRLWLERKKNEAHIRRFDK